jgi:hypothetical protein
MKCAIKLVRFGGFGAGTYVTLLGKPNFILLLDLIYSSGRIWPDTIYCAVLFLKSLEFRIWI